MELNLDLTGIVRLKFFVTRQITGMHTRRNEKLPVREQEAAVLGLLMVAAEKFGSLDNGQIGCLLGMETGRSSTVMNRLKKHGLVNVQREGRRKLYRITEKGVQSVGTFADEVLGTPETIERELSRHAEYARVITFAGSLIDKELNDRLIGAITGKKVNTASGS